MQPKTIDEFIETLQERNLEFVHSRKVLFDGNCCRYTILGNIPNDLAILRITLQIMPYTEARKHITKIDLYDSHQLLKLCDFLCENNLIDTPVSFQADLLKLGDLLQQHREALYEKQEAVPELPVMDIREEKEAIQFLEDKQLVKEIDKHLLNLGIVGESNNRLLTFLIAISYKTAYPLHGIIQSASGSGKSHLINSIAQCIPFTDLLSLTRITSKSLYHYKEGHLVNKLILIQDFTGLDQESQYAFRELQSAGKISCSISRKDNFGEIRSEVKTVHAHFSSLSATTDEIYTDNLSRSILIRINESEEQTLKIVQYQNALLTGRISTEPKQKAIEQLTNGIRVLQPLEVQNPYADKLEIPMEAKEQRRLNQQFQYFILLVTWLHQYQRKRTKDNTILSTKADILLAIELFFDSIMLKIDDLDASTRYFFERLKSHLKKEDANNDQNRRFTQKQIREALRLSKSYTGKCMKILHEAEYIKISSGTVNKGYYYQVVCWQDDQKFRENIKAKLCKQVSFL